MKNNTDPNIKKLGYELEFSGDIGEVDYLMVHQKFDFNCDLKPIEISKFKIE